MLALYMEMHCWFYCSIWKIFKTLENVRFIELFRSKTYPRDCSYILPKNFRSNILFLINCLYKPNHECTYWSCSPTLASSIILSNYKKDLLVFTLTAQHLRYKMQYKFTLLKWQQKKDIGRENCKCNFSNIIIFTKYIFSCKGISDTLTPNIFF